MKIPLGLSCLGVLVFWAGCASDPRPAPVPTPLNGPAPVEARPVAAPADEADLDVPVLAEGVRLFHAGAEVSMEALAGGQIPEGSLIQVSVRPDVRHSVVSDTLVQLHSMGYLVGIRAEGEEESPDAGEAQ